MSKFLDGAGTVPAHLQRSWHENGGDTHLIVKNGFISEAGADCEKQLVRSNSWSVFSSSTSSQQDSNSSQGNIARAKDASRQQRDAPPHFTWEENSNSFDVSDSSDGISRAVDDAADVGLERTDTPIFGPTDGGKLHESGQCVPCIHILHGFSCARGQNCRFCHFEHDDAKKSRRRPCKSTRNRCKQALDELMEKYKDDPETKQQEMQRLVSRHPYVATLVEARNQQNTDTPNCANQSSQDAVPTQAGTQASGNTLRRIILAL